MINVRFFGILRLDIKLSSLSVEASTVDELLKKIAEQVEGTDYKQLKNSIIFVNGTDISNGRGMRTRLNDGDEVQFFSPASGG